MRLLIPFLVLILPVTTMRSEEPTDVLPPERWREIEASIDRGLDYLVRHQRPDGSFDAPRTGQPGVTSLAVLAFLSRGHTPVDGQYGENLLKAVDFVLACQRPDGLLSAAEPEPHHVHDGASHCGNYNHAIAALMLTEVYGMLPPDRTERASAAIKDALRFTRGQQTKPRNNAEERGGVRYLRPRQGWEADLSVTSWQLMFYRSARNAGFEVPVGFVDEAMAYIRRCFDQRQHTFTYNLPGGAWLATHGLAGGGIVSLALGGEHHSDMAKEAGDWILLHFERRYNQGPGPYHYGVYYSSQGMCQLGGEHWKKFFPQLARILLEHQSPDGSWESENAHNGDFFGRSYTTSLSILALTPAYQLLPIYQR